MSATIMCPCICPCPCTSANAHCHHAIPCTYTKESMNTLNNIHPVPKSPIKESKELNERSPSSISYSSEVITDSCEVLLEGNLMILFQPYNL